MDPSAPLLVTDDSLLVSEVQRLAAAAGVVPVVVREAALALRHWPTAVTVLVGADAAEAVSACRAIAPWMPRASGSHPPVSWTQNLRPDHSPR